MKKVYMAPKLAEYGSIENVVLSEETGSARDIATLVTTSSAGANTLHQDEGYSN